MAITNLEMNDETLSHLIRRIRDKNSEIRSTVFRKLINEKVFLSNMNLSEIYKLVYDGLGSRDTTVKNSCIRYLTKNYSMFKDDEDR
jgi:hypothetical protein